MEFCTSCKQLNISLSSFLSHPGTDDNPRLKDPIYSLGTLEQISWRTKTCHLCRLLFAALQKGPLDAVSRLSDRREIAICACWINGLGPSREQRMQSPALSILIWPESPRIPRATYKLVIRAVSRVLPDHPHFGRLSSIESNFLDFELIKRWINHCGTSHITCQKETKALSSKPTEVFLLIDVKNESIVRAPERCRYIALSYVWGDTFQLTLTRDKIKQFSRYHSLRTVQLSRTISDAMKLTAKLGERYLWVDALCIIQDSANIRRQCIEDMGRIYAQSLLTIVTGTAESSNSPLPGITVKRNWKQWSAHISPSLTLSLHFDFKDFLECSKYNLRAWTFQEYQLANRLLIFASNGQVYYSCQEAVFSEDVVPGKSMESDAAMQGGAESVRLRLNTSHPWSTYRRAVETFTFRSLTHEQDVLNAFRGVLGKICPGKAVQSLPASMFDKALLWQPRERCQRRIGFSSWSWAGWIGKVHWFDDSAKDDLDEGIEAQALETWLEEKCWVIWHIASSSKPGLATRLTADRQTPKAPNLYAAGHDERFGFHPHEFAPTVEMQHIHPDTVSAHENHIRYLQFWTVSGYFQLELDTSAVFKTSSFDPENTGNGLRRFLLRDRSGQSCGWVLLDDGWSERADVQPPLIQEFIVLSEGQNSTLGSSCGGTKSSKGKEPVRDTREMNVMMIIWHGDIAERAGLGRITRSALWQTCLKPMYWKEIILG